MGMFMAKQLTIVMYHYVRDLAASAFPEIKGLDTRLFEEQLDYLNRHYIFFSAEDLHPEASLPDNAVLLTFDDGYIDHYITVFPLLRERGIRAVFAPVVNALRGEVLDVNKIHFTLASVKDHHQLVLGIDKFIFDHIAEIGFTGPQHRTTMIKRPLDTVEVSFVKDMLQKDLPLQLRRELVNRLFKEFVTSDEAGFAAELYLHPEHIREMYAEGMAFSIHGLSHSWFTALTREEKRDEIEGALAFFSGLGIPAHEISITYPYGIYDAETLKAAGDAGVSLGFTTESRIAVLTAENMLLLPRFDTNAIPKESDAPFQKL